MLGNLSSPEKLLPRLPANFPSSSAVTKAAQKPAERGFTLRLAIPNIATEPILFLAGSSHFKINFNYVNDIRIPAPCRKLKIL